MRRYERPSKPHIYFRGGFWRVVHMQMKFGSDKATRLAPLWQTAHDYVRELNGDNWDNKERARRLLAPWSKSDAT